MPDIVGADIQARAVQLLRARGDPDAADLLAECTLDVAVDEVGDVGLLLTGPFSVHEGPLDLVQPMAATLAHALRAVLPAGVWVERLIVRPGEKTPHVVELVRTAPNQAVVELAPRTWAGMRFRSDSEVRIAQALDRAGALFLPGALARLGSLDARHNREADFLVCWQGAWGILEVDGEPFHGPEHAAADAERDQLFRQHGVALVAHYDAARCFTAPDAVVADFLATLRHVDTA
jgi:hypothetical protein